MKIQGFQAFLQSTDVYKPQDILTVLHEVRPNFRFAYTNTKIKYFNVPFAFDIETSSFFRLAGKEQEKVAIMYMWSFGLYGEVIIGRTWKDFLFIIGELTRELDLNSNKRIIIYVHNLSYEFQFIRKYFNWDKVFCLDNRKPIYALTDTGVEFRCSYLLSGYSLAKLGDELQTYKVKKAVGDLDYSKIRHSNTLLTTKEIGYSRNDVKVVMAYIAEQIERNADIAHIPLTKTGYVRNYCRNSCFYEPNKRRKESFKRLRYKELMKSLQLSAEEYLQLKAAFQGGFTHANPFYANKVVINVTSFDFTSSYPCVMLAEKFPMSSSEKIEIRSKEEFNENLRLYCCLFDIEFNNLQSKLFFENYISISRCREVVKANINNGRVVSAEHLITTITEQDYLIIKQFYVWEHMRIGNFRRYKKDYLPTDFVKAIIKLYHDKTTLKGVEGMEIEYLNSKEMLNACYGMAVTDIVRPEIIYTDDWQPPQAPNIDEVIEKYNKSNSRFLFYPWGVWVTAYARRNLFTGILEFKDDYIYSDTDSIKVCNAEKHTEYIEKYNQMIKQQLFAAMEYHKIDPQDIEPKTIKGVKKCLGVWDFDGHYSKFKTLGAKRYMVQYSNDPRNPASTQNHINLTVSGLNKSVCVPYLLDKYGEKGIFKAFNNDLYIPAGYTGKGTLTYIDEERRGIVTDYLGVSAEYDELSAVHMENAEYSLKLSKNYLDYLLDIDFEYR